MERKWDFSGNSIKELCLIRDSALTLMEHDIKQDDDMMRELGKELEKRVDK